MKLIRTQKYYAVNAKKKEPFRRVIVAVVGFLAKILYRPQYYNQHYIPQEESFLLLGNHHSLLDPVLVHLGMPRYVHWVAKKELFEKKFFARIFHKLKVIPLDRKRVDLAAMRMIRKNILNDKITGLFPQGTRVKPDKYQETKAQAGVASICMSYDCTIVPFYCDGPYKLFRKNMIVFGPPYCLNKNLSVHSKNDKKQQMADELLRISYGLVGKVFP